nr:unnamed protein product [Callosobruchus chinensis]
MMGIQEVQHKVSEYENFIEERLKRDLKDIEFILQDKVTKFKEWEEVKQVTRTVKDFKAKNRDMSLRIDVGDGIMTCGEVSDYERTYVCIGLGYMLEMDCDEAEKYADIRLKILKKEIDHLRNMAVEVKVHIKMVLLAISELQASFDKLYLLTAIYHCVELSNGKQKKAHATHGLVICILLHNIVNTCQFNTYTYITKLWYKTSRLYTKLDCCEHT